MMEKKINLEFLNNPNWIANIRTSIIFIFVLGSAAVYWGIYDSFKLETLLDPQIGGLGIIGIMNLRLTRYEVTNRAMEDEYKDNNQLQELDKNIANDIDKIDIDKAIKVIDEKNIEGRKKYNILYTQKIIHRLNNKIFRLKVRGKSTTEITNKIKILKLEPLQIRWYNLFTPKYKDINIHKFMKKDKNYRGVEIAGNGTVMYNPRSDGRYTSWIFTIMNLLGLTSAGAFMFAYNTPIGLVISYYVFLIICMIWTIIRRYPKIRLLRRTREISVKINKRELLQEINISSVSVLGSESTNGEPPIYGIKKEDI